MAKFGWCLTGTHENCRHEAHGSVCQCDCHDATETKGASA